MLWARSLALFTVLAGCLSAADTLLIVNKEGVLAMVDPATRQVLARVPTGPAPHEVAASSDGRMAFVSNYGDTTPGNSISVIDLEARKEVRRVGLGPLRRPHGLDFAGGKLYLTCETNKAVARYDPETNQVDWVMGTGQNTTHMVRVTADLNRIFTANIGSNSISILDRVGTIDWNQTVVAVGQGPEGFDITPDGKELWTATSGDGGISILNLVEKRVIRTFSVQTKRSNRLRFTPDGRLALISDLDAGELVVLERATLKVLKRLPLGRQPAGILMDPGGALAYVAVTGDNFVAVIDLKALQLAARIVPGTGPDGMAWAGNGSGHK